MPNTPKPVALDSTAHSLSTAIQGINNAIDTQAVQRDWDENNKKSKAFIKNKPNNLWSPKTITGNPLSFQKRKAEPANETLISMNPIQDLHGYGYPWPAGGGKNLFNGQLLAGYIDENGVVRSESSTVFCHSDYIPCDGSPMMWSGINGRADNVKRLHCYDSSKNWLGNAYFLSVPYTGEPYSMGGTMPTGTAYICLSFAFSDTNVQLEYGSTATAYVPYSNVCPISGSTQVSLNGCGKNMFNKNNSSEILDLYFNRDELKTSTSVVKVVFVKCKPNTTYTVSKQQGERFAVAYTKEMPNVNVTVFGYIAFNGYTSITITTGEDAKYLVAYIYHGNYDSVTPEQMISSVQIEEGSATTYEPYQSSNDLTVIFPAVRANQWDEEWEVGGINNQGNNSNYDDRIRTKGYIPILPDTVYYLKSPNALYIRYYDVNKIFLSTDNGRNNQNVTTPQNAYYMRFYVSDAYGAVYNNNISINYPATVTSYEPYINTVYGCTLDVEKGELVVNSQFFVFDTANKINNIISRESGSHSIYRYTIKNVVVVSPSFSTRGCSHFINATINSQTTDYGYYAYTSSSIAPNDMYLQFRNNDVFNTLTECKAWFTEQMNNGTPVQCWFTLATPITISLTPQQVNLLRGINNIWTDGDSISLTYKDDAKNITDVATDLNYISTDIATNESTISTAAYQVGDYLILNNNFYKVTAPISIGDTIAVGTNVTITTIGAELSLLHS